MKFKEIGKYNPKALEYLKEVQPFDFAKQSPLRRLDFLLGIVEKEKPEILSDYIEKLKERYKEMVKTEYLEKKSLILTKILESFLNLKNYPELALHNLNFFLNIMEISTNVDWNKENVKIPQRNFLRSFLIPKYTNLHALATVIERDQAIQIYKKYIVDFVVYLNQDKNNRVEDLESLSKNYFETDEIDESESWVTIYSKPLNGKLLFRKDVCLWDEALSDLTDSEFKYLVCCYGDFQGMKRENKNFVLTMEHTIAKGDAYCSCVVHDTRIDCELKHPPKEFWDDIWQLHDWQRKE